jgi:hypothetical protein
VSYVGTRKSSVGRLDLLLLAGKKVLSFRLVGGNGEMSSQRILSTCSIWTSA